MWPKNLDLTRDQCRGILRRLEVESYTSVIGTFRAQGGLSEGKAKILKELREVFHITPERHIAEVRKISNDEELCTVAEMLAGPNTGHGWTKEGHRNFPVLSRGVPHTALLPTANKMRDVAEAENQRLPLPGEEVQENNYEELPISSKPVVTEDPLQAVHTKQVLKRPHTTSESKSASKKRISETVPLNHTNMRIQQLYHSHSKTQTPQRKAQTKRTSAKGAAKATPKAPKQKNNSTPGSSGSKQSAKNAKIVPAYGSSVKSNKASFASTASIDKSLMGETFPEKPFNWPHANDVTTKTILASNMPPSLPHQLQQQLAPAHPPPPPVQIVYTSQMEPTDISNNIMDPMNNLITESTPITWLNKPPTTAANNSRPMKMLIPAQTATSTRKNAAAFKVNNSHHNLQQPTKPTKTSRRKIFETVTNEYQLHSPMEPAQHIKHHHQPLPSPTATIPTPPPPIMADTSLRIQSITTNINTQSLQPVVTPTTIVQKPIFQNITSIKAASPSLNNTSTPMTKPKIQITNQQIITPGNQLNVKLQAPVQMKGLSKGNVVKLIQSSDGKMVIQGRSDVIGTSVNSSTMQPMTSVKNVGGIVTNNKISLQKIHLIPSTKPFKTNMFVMQKLINQGTLSTAGTVPMLSEKIVIQNKSSKFNVSPPPPNPIAIKDMSGKQQQNNVVVLDVCDPDSKNSNLMAGLLQAGPALTHELSANDGKPAAVITEDTPVDIISTDNLTNDNIIINVPSVPTAAAVVVPQSTTTTPQSPLELKNTSQIMKHLKSVTTVQSIPYKANTVQLKQKHKADKVVVGDVTIGVSNAKKPRIDRNETNFVAINDNGSAVAAGADGDDGGRAGNIVIGTTDWEDELDQANITKTTSIQSTASSNQSNAVMEYVEDDGSENYICDEMTPNEDDIIQYDDGDDGNTVEFQHVSEVVTVPSQNAIKLPNSTRASISSTVPTTTPITAGSAIATTVAGTATTTTIVPHTPNHTIDIFSTAITSAQINMNTFNTDDEHNKHGSRQMYVTTTSTTGGSTVNGKDDEGISSSDAGGGGGGVGSSGVGSGISDDESTKVSDESMMLQMQEYDESGSSQMRNVRLEELVTSGHIVAIDSNE